jgi:hypothetical protein
MSIHQPNAAAQAGDGWVIVSGVYYLKPQAQVTGQYAYCRDLVTGQVIDHCDVAMSMAFEPDSGGHLHNANRPMSTLNPTGGNTGTTGLPFTVATPRIGQQEWWQICASVCNQFYWIVGYPDLIDLPAASNINRIGSTPTHQSNHWVLPYVADALRELVTEYLAAWPVSGGQLSLNDSALIFGGRFDINANWTGEHSQHGRGTAQDVRGNCGYGSVPHNLPAQNAFMMMAVNKGALPPPVSIQSEKASTTCDGTSQEHHHIQWASPASAYGPPLPPGSPGATRVSNSQIYLAWSDGSDNENGFEIQRKIGAGGTWQSIVAVDPDIQSYTDTGLDDGTAYYYRILAFNDEGTSATSEVFACTCTSLGAGDGTYYWTFAEEIAYTGYWFDELNGYGWWQAWGAVGATTRFSFVGDRVTWYYRTDFFHGTASVKIDGNLVGYIDQYTPWAMWCVGKTWAGLGPGNHTIEITPISGDIATLGFEVNLAPLHSPDHYGLADWYMGSGWTVQSGNSWTNVGDDCARFNFVGDALTYWHDTGPDRGWVTITIDGINKGSFNHYSPDYVSDVATSFYELGPGPHTIVIVNWGLNPPGTVLDVKGLTVY